VTGQFIDPPNNEIGAAATGDIYAYIDSTSTLLASYYVETPELLSETVGVSATLQRYDGNNPVSETLRGLTATITTVQYDDSHEQILQKKRNSKIHSRTLLLLRHAKP
jgi:hypothetical protein